jgi:hypothetical protein
VVVVVVVVGSVVVVVGSVVVVVVVVGSVVVVVVVASVVVVTGRIGVSHVVPVNPAIQIHWKPPIMFSQMPFLHGSCSQLSTRQSQCVPVQPTGH